MKNSNFNTDEYYMKQALRQAEKAYEADEVPVGAVIVLDGKIIARGRNKRNKSKDATEHAEMIAIKKACKTVGDWRLNGATLYVTLEPCAMCAGAAVNARINKIVFGASDKNAGCCGSVLNIPKDFRLNHTTDCVGGVMENECAEILKKYFKSKRKSLS
ncbi:MAG TPA: tRNA adenosine(34) deaminase TadA [Eubacteriales bacterium]|nr:tRNA adenosine(34) deaminase TadA [Eubacteriales bacterium]